MFGVDLQSLEGCKKMSESSEMWDIGGISAVNSSN